MAHLVAKSCAAVRLEGHGKLGSADISAVAGHSVEIATKNPGVITPIQGHSCIPALGMT